MNPTDSKYTIQCYSLLIEQISSESYYLTHDFKKIKNMKHITLLITVLAFTLTLSAASFKIKVTNQGQFTQHNFPVVLKLNNYSKIHPTQREKLAVYVNGQQISSQLDDMNGDRIPDELVFQLDLKAGESRKVQIKTINAKRRKAFDSGVYASLIVKEKDGSHRPVTEVSSTKNDMYNALHHHGVAFESKLMAYRIYFDNKSTIDIYGKRKPQLEIAQTGWYPTDEQLKAGFGDDILLVSGWVGVGTVKGWNGKKAIHIEKFDKRTQRIVTLGNVRTIVESEVTGWEYEGKKTDLRVRYTIYAGQRHAMCEVTASNDIDQLATGVQQIGGGQLFKSSSLTGSWGTHFPQPDTVKYKKETAGLGVFMPIEFKAKNVVAGVDNLLLFPVKKGQTVRFYLTASWAREENNTFTKPDDYFGFLKVWSTSLNEAVVE